jgi:hypothetical protein
MILPCARKEINLARRGKKKQIGQEGGQVRERIITERCREKNAWRKIRDCVLRRREDSDCERVIMVRDDTIGLGTLKGCVASSSGCQEWLSVNGPSALAGDKPRLEVRQG